MPRKPNIVCIITDDTDPSYFGFAGGPYLTPNLDALAAAGTRFTSHHSVGAVCTPARYGYMTGQWPGRCPNEQFLGPNPKDRPYNLTWNVGLVPGQDNLATILKDNGYTTAYVGKYHCGRPPSDLGMERIPEPNDPYDPKGDAVRRRNQERAVAELKSYGWDFVRNISYGNLDLNPHIALDTHNQEWITQGALEFLAEPDNVRKPFCLYVGANVVHGPKHGENLLDLDPRVTPAGLLDEPATGGHPPRESIFERLRAAGLTPNHRNVGMLWLDDAVGVLRTRIRQLGLEQDTIFIYKSDHGVIGKASCYHTGSKVPVVWSWPGRIRAGAACHVPVQNVDFLPTLADLCELRLPAGYHLDGASYAAQLTDGSPRPVHEDLYNEIGLMRSVECGRWHYIAFRHTAQVTEQMKSGALDVAVNSMMRPRADMATLHHAHYYDVEQLYDTAQDTWEQMNLAGLPQYADVLAQMRERLRRHLDTLEHPFPAEADPFFLSEQYARLVQNARRTLTVAGIGYFHEGYW